MRNVLTSILLISLFASCNNREELDELEIKDMSYSFEKIEYIAVNDSSRGFTSFDIPTVNYFNNTNVEQKYSYNPFAGFDNEVSQFASKDSEAFVIEDTELFVPLYIDENNKISLGDKKWKYTYVVQQQRSTLNFATDLIIPPHKELIINAKLFYRKYRVNYKLFLKGNQTKKEKIIEGIWTGIYPDYPETNISTSDL